MEEFYLEEPSIKRKNEAIEFIDEFYKYGSQIHGVGGLSSSLKESSYEEWINECENMKDNEFAMSRNLAPGVTYFMIRKSDNNIIGMINLRLKLTEFLRNLGGNIGYSIRPIERKKGYAKIQLYLCLLKAKEYGLENVLVTCADYNEGSRKTIEALGGIFEKENVNSSDGEVIQLYWIDVNKSINENKNIIVS